MPTRAHSSLSWIPRILAIAYSCFLALFALDVFESHSGFFPVLFGLLLHLVPTFIMLAILLAAWRWPLVGTVGYAVAGITYAVMVHGRPDWVLFIAGPLFLISIFFFLDWRQRRRHAGSAPMNDRPSDG